MSEAQLLAAVLALVPAIVLTVWLALRPLRAMQVAVYLQLLPLGLRLEPAYTVIVNGALLLALCSLAAFIIISRRPIVWTTTASFFLLCIAWAVVTLLWAPDWEMARRKLVAYCIGTSLFILLLNLVRRAEGLEALLQALRWTGWTIVIGAGVQIAIDRPDLSQRIEILGMNENETGLFLIVALPAVLWPVFRYGTGRKTYTGMSFVYLLGAMAVTALTGSRGSAFAMLIAFVGLLFVPILRTWGILGLGMVLMTVSTAQALVGTLMSRIAESTGGWAGGRDVIWRASLRFISDHPWGGGIGNGRYQLAPYINGLTRDFILRNDMPSHNPFLEAAVDTGVIGLILYAGAILTVFLSFRRARQLASEEQVPVLFFNLMLATTPALLFGWLQGGGLEIHPAFFVVLALLAYPALQLSRSGEWQPTTGTDPEEAANGKGGLFRPAARM
jgi:putative inorganic carbon (hco3(-)) transporter